MSSKQPTTGNDPTLPAEHIAHQSAEAVLTVGEHYLLIGNADAVQVSPTGAGGTPDPARNPIFDDDAHYNAWMLQLDARGQPVWERAYRAPRECYARAVAALPGGFIIAGEHRSDAEREYQGWLLRTAHDRDGALGDEVWRLVLGRPGATALRAVVIRADGTILAAGTQQGRGWVVAVDGNGTLRWERELDELDEVTALLGHAGGVVLAGITGRTTTDLGSSRLIAIDEDGQTLWSTPIPAQGRGELVALAALADGGVAVGQSQAANDRRRGAWVVRFGLDGTVHSSTVLPGSHIEIGRAVVATPDGGYAIAGDSFEHFRDRRVRLWRIGADGALRWQGTYGTSGHDLARGLALAGDGGLLAVGAMQMPQVRKTRLLGIKVDAQGREEWQLARNGQ
jgi:outer membrane protein assembly factor BamB